MKIFHKINLISLLLIAALITGCAVFSKMGKSPYAGKWSYTLDTGQGIYKGFITIIKDGKIYTGTISYNEDKTDLRDFVIQDGKLSAVLDAEGYTFDLTGTFKEDIFTGSLSTSDFDLPFSANKVRE